ncbi:tetratricopeptide (TPR) repeat protein [Neobacillus niacini]|uniref:tetratricopeptide repeat protein n=1 Tax=Neobacillus niacini TaxID=86668 RepID=UPI00285B3B51|nr:hypothetical protein [Neobacillus niacini]MDR7076878.1 tetratricopeptide (TPR) repeat protein [Neobacillus niacini]
MDTEIFMPTEITIKEKNKFIKAKVVRTAILARSKVVEVLSEDNERFYFIYYKNSLIYGNKLDHVKEDTFIHNAFTEGLIINAPHPLLTALIPNLSILIPNKNKLFSQLETHYSLEEIAYIATTLDSFLKKDQLINFIDNIYFHFRRNGSFMNSFQVVQILHDFSPALKSAQERLNLHDFNKYRDFYQTSNLPSILIKDPLFVEIHCFKDRFNPEKRILLKEILSAQQDGLGELLLWLEEAEKFHEIDSIKKYSAMALRFVTMEEWVQILALVKINPFREFPDSKRIVENMIQKGNYEKSALILLNFIGDLPASYDDILSKIWRNSDSRFVIAHVEEFISLLKQLPEGETPKELEQKIFQIVVVLLERDGLKSVYEKLLPIHNFKLEVIKKIGKMVELMEDPDRMMELGDYYAEFKQFDQAIDCFFWEMELQPQNPSPVWKICKMYQSKGMIKEAATYQKIYEQLKDHQEIS